MTVKLWAWIRCRVFNKHRWSIKLVSIKRMDGYQVNCMDCGCYGTRKEDT